MERGFLDSGDKKKKKDGDGVKKDAMDEAANVGIAVKVKFIDGKLRKPIRGAPSTMDVPAMGSIKGRDSHLEKVYTYVGGPPTKSILNKTDYENGEARNGGKNTPTKVRFEPISTSTVAIPDDAEGSSNGGTCEARTNCSFASLVRPKESSTKVHFRALVNDEKLESFDCVLPKAAASKSRAQKKGVDAKSNSTYPFAFSNAVGNEKGVSNSGLNTSNPFDVLNVDGDAMGESGTQPKLEDEDFDFYEGYADQVVDLDGALKDFCDFKLSMSGRK
nr:hypothetical protein [Tanacetum cinerariifolium]